MWVLLLWKRYDFRDLFFFTEDGKPMIFSSEEAADVSGRDAVLAADYKYRVVRVD
jgi:hypothetical protein